MQAKLRLSVARNLLQMRQVLDEIVEEIGSLDDNDLASSNLSDLENFYLGQILVDPLELDCSNKFVDSQEAVWVSTGRRTRTGEQESLPGTRLTIGVPYKGDSWLWKVQPSRGIPYGKPDTKNDREVIRFQVDVVAQDASPQKISMLVEEKLDRLRRHVGRLRQDIDRHNSLAEGSIRSILTKKRMGSLKVLRAIEDTGIPVRRRKKQPAFSLPARKVQRPVQKQELPRRSSSPEPLLNEEEYQHILRVMRSMAIVMERSPNTFSDLDEDDIRNHFLIQLNGHYEGSATGETFNASGKTDILVRAGERNVFIAECKIWRGPRSIAAALDQLLGYLTWRDSKCALIVFSRNKNISSVQDRLHESVEAHPGWSRTERRILGGDSRYLFVKKDDPSRGIVITTQLYDVGSAQDR